MTVKAPDLLARFERVLDETVFNLNDPRLHDWTEHASGVRVGRNLHQTFVVIAEYGPLRTTDVGERLGLDTSTVSRYVSALVSEGLVERISDPADGRVRVVRTTPHGTEVLGKLWTRYRELLDDALSGFGPEERDVLVALLGRFSDGLSACMATRGIAVPQRRR